MITTRTDFHVVPRGQYWAVKEERGVHDHGVFLTKVEACGYGVFKAREARVSLVVHGRDGVIQTVYSYTGRYPSVDDSYTGVGCLRV